MQGKEVDIDLATSTDVLRFLENGGNVNDFDWDGETPLMIAVQQKDNDLFERLLQKHADINAANAWGETVLMMAAERNDVQWVSKLLEKGAQINQKNKHGETALFYAVRADRSDIVQTLMQAGAELNIQNEQGQSALMIACSRRNADIVKDLLKGKPELNKTDREKRTALMHYLEGSLRGKDQVGKTAFLLMTAGADLTSTDAKGTTLFEMACRAGFYDFAAELLKKDTVNIQSVSDENKLMACIADNREVKQLLSEKCLERRKALKNNQKNFWTRLFGRSQKNNDRNA